MKVRFESNFAYGQKLVKFLLIAAIGIWLAAALLVPRNSSYQIVLIVSAFICLIAAVVIIYRYCRCPYCGKRIFGGVLVAKSCPSCRRNLITGKKVKKNG